MKIKNEKYKAKVGYGETMIVNSFLDVDISDLLLLGVVIYKCPEDMPHYEYVCRLREITKDLPTNIVIVRNSLEECREDIMIAFPFMTVFPRDKRDLKLKSSKSKEVGYGPICYKKLFGSKVKIRNKSVSKSTYKFNLNDMPGQMSIDDFISTSEK